MYKIVKEFDNSLRMMRDNYPHLHLFNSGKQIIAEHAFGNVLMFIDIEENRYKKNGYDFQGNSITRNTLSISPNDRFISFASEDKNIHSIDMDNETGFDYEISDNFGSSISNRVQFSNDSKMAAMVGNRTLCVFNTETGDRITSANVMTENDAKLKFHPSGSFITYMNYHTLSAYQIPSMEKMWEYAFDDGGPNMASWDFSQDGFMMVLANYEDALTAMKSYTGKVIASFTKGNNDNLLDAHFSDDGKKIIASSADKLIRVWNLEKAIKMTSIQASSTRNSYQPTTSLLDVVTGKHDDSMIDKVFAYDNFTKALSITSWDSVIYSWDITTGELLDRVVLGFSIEDIKFLIENENHYLIVAGISDEYAMNANLRPRPDQGPMIRICKFRL